MTHIWLIRHADYRYELSDGLYRDLGLSEAGVDEANRVGERLEHGREIEADVLLSSPERGARETADVVARALKLCPELDEGLAEWQSDDGTENPEDFMRRWSETPETDRPFTRWSTNGETRVEFVARVQSVLHRIVGANEGKRVAIVSHGAFIQVSFLYFFGYGEASLQRGVADTARTSITHWHRDGARGRWRLERANDCLHLRYGARFWSESRPG